MILNRYIFKELLKSQFVVLVVLVAIFAGQSVVRLMSEASVGNLPPRLILLFLLYSLPEFLIFLFPLTLYVAIIITLGRICSDSEMVVMRAVGYSPKRIMGVALCLSTLSVVVVGYISLILVPYAANQRYELEQQMTNNPEFLPIDSGRFVTLGSYNVYVEDVNSQSLDNKDIQNIYVMELNYNTNRPQTITAAKEGHVLLDEDGVRWLQLSDGRRYEFSDKNLRRAEFDSFRAPISGNVTEETKRRRDIARMSTAELLQSDVLREQVEAQWRFSPLLSTFIFCMIAVPLSMVNPRQGRFARLMPAILIYVAYYMFLLSLRNLILTDIIPLYPGLYVVPLFFLIFVAIPLNLPKSLTSRKRSRPVPAKAGAYAGASAADTDDNAGADDTAPAGESGNAATGDKTEAAKSKDQDKED